MNQQTIPSHTTTGAKFVRAVRRFITSESGLKAKLMFSGLVILLFCINGLNVLNNYVGRDFMTAIAERNTTAFIRQTFFYLSVFAASTLVAVISRFLEERLGLLWREYITRRTIRQYLFQGTYYRLESRGELANPDQRIADDIRTFTVTALSFVLMGLNSSFTIVAFSGVLWSISPLLFGVAVAYAALGSYFTFVLGRPLIKLNYDQLDKEANFRSGLIHVRENAESVLLAKREGRIISLLLRRLEDLLANIRRIIAVNRNMGFFTTGYNWVIQIIPALIVAPAYISGKIEFGVITQSAAAFMMLVGAFSLIITQFQSISNFAAVVARISAMVDAMEKPPSGVNIKVAISDETNLVVYENVTIVSPQDGKDLLKALSLTIRAGTRVLIAGTSEAGKTALFKATAGIAATGRGRIIRPSTPFIQFLAERPYLPPGTLREALVPTILSSKISNDHLYDLFKELNLESVLARTNGFDTEHDWATVFSLGEQQLLSFIHIFLAAPRFIFLDHPSSALRPDQIRMIFDFLNRHSITYFTVEDSENEIEFYDALLEINEKGQWAWRPFSAGSTAA